MDEEVTTTSTKKISRAKKTVTKPEETETATEPIAPKPSKATDSISETYTLLINKLTTLQTEYNTLQKQITETKESWIKEQKNHQLQVEELNKQEDLQRKRDQETYFYGRERERKIAEDQFTDKKVAWEKYLKDQKEALDKNHLELEELRKKVATFESEKQQTINEAQEVLQKQLTQAFETEKRLREQEIKAEKEMQNLKITNLTTENSRQAREIEALRKALEEATQQVKDIAVKVIESGSSSNQSSRAKTEEL